MKKKRPGAALLGTGSKRDKTTLVRLRSGHTRAQRHLTGLKIYSPSPNCHETQAVPAHFMACICCHKSQLLFCPATGPR
ncbi:hypothetical protein TNCV_1551751 [Trichonephila clavipes]|nr:hypothetical protein TNCV_1551751 [Trichonephila clavipes]